MTTDSNSRYHNASTERPPMTTSLLRLQLAHIPDEAYRASHLFTASAYLARGKGTYLRRKYGVTFRVVALVSPYGPDQYGVCGVDEGRVKWLDGWMGVCAVQDLVSLVPLLSITARGPGSALTCDVTRHGRRVCAVRVTADACGAPTRSVASHDDWCADHSTYGCTDDWCSDSDALILAWRTEAIHEIEAEGEDAEDEAYICERAAELAEVALDGAMTDLGRWDGSAWTRYAHTSDEVAA